MASGLYQGLSVGLFYKDRQVHWPPYMPDRTALLTKMVEPTELLLSDQPWAVAWYADRTCVWLPRTKVQFGAIQKEAAKQNLQFAGIVISPSSSLEDRLHSQLTGAYGAWSEYVLRGPLMGLGVDVAASLEEEQAFKPAFPLAGAVMPDGRVLPLMVFYADRVRWADLK
jgi:hypothetical protein